MNRKKIVEELKQKYPEAFEKNSFKIENMIAERAALHKIQDIRERLEEKLISESQRANLEYRRGVEEAAKFVDECCSPDMRLGAAIRSLLRPDNPQQEVKK